MTTAKVVTDRSFCRAAGNNLLTTGSKQALISTKISQRRHNSGNFDQWHTLGTWIIGHMRHTGNQPLGIGMARVGDDIINRSLLNLAASVHYHHPLGQLADRTHIMGNQDNRGACFPLQNPQQIKDLCLYGDIQRGGRLISD